MSGVLIMAGGTGGHVYPGLAVARKLLEKHVKVVWLGTQGWIEARAVPASGLGIEMEWITIRGVRHRGWLSWLLLPFILSLALLQALRVVRRRRPDVVLSLGGFTAGPGGLVAFLTRTPLLIHEQNAIPGMTNKWLALLADQVLCGLPSAFGRLARVRLVGNPVRQEITALSPPAQRMHGRRVLRLLVIGGSQGARFFNETVPEVMKRLAAERCPEVWHQCGRGHQAQTQAAYAGTPIKARVSEFIENIAAAYEWADLVLCRAGAMTIAELAASGSAAILVPYPYAVDDHQTANARFLAERGAALVLPQTDVTPLRLAELLQELANHREAIVKMATAARACAVLDADETVATLCLEAMHA